MSQEIAATLTVDARRRLATLSLIALIVAKPFSSLFNSSTVKLGDQFISFRDNRNLTSKIMGRYHERRRYLSKHGMR